MVSGGFEITDWNCGGEGFAGEVVEKFVPSKNILHSPHPNPFNLSTVISLELRDASFVKLAVYDLMGREVARVIDGFHSAGIYQRTFDGSRLSSGVYFARLKSVGFSQTVKMLLIK